jgi:signal transduction histidine kinase
MAMASQRWFIIFVSVLVALTENGLGQGAVRWSFYKTANGLAGQAYNSVSFTPQGKLVAANSNPPLVSELDGYFVSNSPAPAGFIGRIGESPGGQLWALAPTELLEFKNGVWLQHPVPRISEASRFLPTRQGCVLLLFPEKISEFSAEDPVHPQLADICTAAQLQISSLTGMALSGDGGLWVCGARGLAHATGPARNVSAQTQWQKYVPPVASQLENLSEPKPDDAGVVLMGESAVNHQKVVVTFDGNQWAALPAGTENFFCAWRGPAHSLWAVTSESLFQWNEARARWIEDEDISVGRIFDTAVEPGGAFWLATSDGLIRGTAALWQKPETSDDANMPASVINPANNPDVLFSAPNGDLWRGGEHPVSWRHNGQWQTFVPQGGTAPERGIGFAEAPDGKIWCATSDELWEFDGKNWLLLQTRFNHINSLLQGRDGSIWLASNGGLFRFYKDAWLKNGTEDGLPNGPVRVVCADGRGQIWADTSDGPFVFHPEADPDIPKTFVRRLAGEDSQLSEGGTLNLLLEGHDKWEFALPSRLLYSYQLDQAGWSAFRDTALLSFSDLAPGKHYFQVRAIDSAGNLETAPASFNFTVTVPWFREIRLWVVLVLGAGAAIFFAAVAWNRHRQLVLSHAAVERKVAERTRELEIATRELLHSQKMNALGTLAAGIAHDFNNILSIIKGSAQIIEDNPGQPEKIRTRVDRIKTVVQQGAEIVDAMLGFSRGSDVLPATCNANAVVTDTMKLLGDRFLREVVVKFDRGEKLPEIVAPREFIQQILLNFIFNAAEAMNGHKEITLATRTAEKLPPDIFLMPSSSPSFVLISVRDVGGGIAPEIMPRIFEPFFTTKALSSRRGTGLGLSMVYELAKKMEAGLAVQSVIGQGSTFTLILPVTNHPDPKAGQKFSP